MDIDAFGRDGYVVARGAVAPGIAAACRELIWQSLERRGIRRADPAGWPALVRIDDLTDEPFLAAATSPVLTAAYDELIGPARWTQRVDAGRAVVVRFPAADSERGNAGYHIEGSYLGPRDEKYWVNVRSRGRGLLTLFLFTDVGPQDAPTRLVCGSHRYVPRFLERYGEAGTRSDGEFWQPSVLCRQVTHATGLAGDVFLCHPFLVHTATWPHRGGGPRMIAQPAVHVQDGFVLDGSDPSPVARAIMQGLAQGE